MEEIKQGSVFGKLTVISKNNERSERIVNGRKWDFYDCLCECGNKKTIRGFDLLSGNTKSCGKHRSGETRKGKNSNLQGKVFGNLTVIERDMTKNISAGKHIYWICKCGLCGNTKSIRSSDLINGRVTDCGCTFKYRISDIKCIDLSGKRFGHLQVIGKDVSKIKSGTHSSWICKCDLCGRTEIVKSDMLIHYGKDRCKICCGISNGEMKILELFEENDIPFIHDKPFGNFKFSDTNGTPRFDFRVTKNSDCDYIVEFDGEQHYKPISMYDNTLTFQNRIKRDKEKNKFCIDNGIPLIRIPYYKLKTLTISDLIPETTKYLVN